MPHTLPGMVSALCALSASVFALLRGRTPERVGAIAILLATALHVVSQDRTDWLDPQRRQLAVDVGLLVALAVLVSTSKRKWLIPATAAQLLSCVVHFVLPFTHGVRGMAYLAVENTLAYVLLASLAAGTAQVARTEGRAAGAEAKAEAARLIALYGADVAYEVAVRHAQQARGARQALLSKVMHEVIRTRERRYAGDTASPRGR